MQALVGVIEEMKEGEKGVIFLISRSFWMRLKVFLMNGVERMFVLMVLGVRHNELSAVE